MIKSCSNIYNQDFNYPATNIESKRMSLRGYEMLNIKVVPFEYNPKTKERETIIDLCAGAGGKSLFLADILKNTKMQKWKSSKSHQNKTV